MDQAKKEYIRKCFVPSCKNSTVTAPNKVFLHVPAKDEVRRHWFLAVGRLSEYRYMPRIAHCCEDHFNVRTPNAVNLEISFEIMLFLCFHPEIVFYMIAVGGRSSELP